MKAIHAEICSWLVTVSGAILPETRFFLKMLLVIIPATRNENKVLASFQGIIVPCIGVILFQDGIGNKTS